MEPNLSRELQDSTQIGKNVAPNLIRLWDRSAIATQSHIIAAEASCAKVDASSA